MAQKNRMHRYSIVIECGEQQSGSFYCPIGAMKDAFQAQIYSMAVRYLGGKGYKARSCLDDSLETDKPLAEEDISYIKGMCNFSDGEHTYTVPVNIVRV